MTEAGSINARTRWRTLLAAEFNSDVRANSSLPPFSTVFERVPSRDSGNLTGGIRDEINYLIPVSISLVNNNSYNFTIISPNNPISILRLFFPSPFTIHAEISSPTIRSLTDSITSVNNKIIWNLLRGNYDSCTKFAPKLESVQFPDSPNGIDRRDNPLSFQSVKRFFEKSFSLNSSLDRLETFCDPKIEN